jgi:AhpD family alkylhydroperoxidase
MPTIRLIEANQAPLLARRHYAGGDPGPLVGALAHVPELLEVALPFIGTALGPSAIQARTKELVIVRTSALLGCAYCTQTHMVVALDAGLSRAEVVALTGLTPSAAGFADPAERALLGWVEAVAGTGAVPDRARSALADHWADHEIVELTLLVGATMMLNRFATALALPTGAQTLRRLRQEALL